MESLRFSYFVLELPPISLLQKDEASFHPQKKDNLAQTPGHPHLFQPLPQTKHNPMSAFWILPFNVLMRTPDSAASALVTAFVSYVHPDFFPLIHFCRTEDRADLIRTVVQTNIGIHNGEM